MKGFIDRLLKRYEHADYMIALKAKLMFFICGFGLLIIPAIIIYTAITHLVMPAAGGRVQFLVLAPTTMLFLIFLVAFILLIRGRFTIAAHLIFTMAQSAVWMVMFLDESPALPRLNSVVLVVAILSLAPLVIARRGWVIPLYGLVNITVLTVFMNYQEVALDLPHAEMLEHLADNTAAILIICCISYALYSITRQSLEQAATSNRRLLASNEELAATNEELEATMEELTATNEEFEAQNAELLAAHEELNRQIRFNARLIATTPALITRYNLREEKFEFVSPHVLPLTGYTESEFMQTPDILDRLIHPGSRRRIREWWESFPGETAKEYQNEFEIITKPGEVKTVLQTVVFIKGSVEKSPLLEGIATDITYRKNAEKAVKDSERKYRMIAQNAVDIIFTMDMEFRFTYISPSVERMRGYSVEEAMAQSLDQVLTPPSLAAASAAMLEAKVQLERGDIERTVKLELEEYCKNGSTIWTDNEFSFLKDEHGVPVGILGVTRNISELKKTQSMLLGRARRVEKQMKAIGAIASSDAVWKGDFATSMRSITEIVSDCFEVERAGIWLLNESATALRCVDLFERSHGRHSNGQDLDRETFRDEIEYLLGNQYMDAHDAVRTTRLAGGLL